MDLFQNYIDIPKDLFLATGELFTPVPPYTFGGLNRGIGRVHLRNYWTVCIVKTGLENTP